MKKLEEIFTFMWDRLNERSSWYAIVCLILDAVMIVTPDWADTIITNVIPVLGAALFITPDKKTIRNTITNIGIGKK